MSPHAEDTYEVLNLIGRGSFGEIRRVKRHRDGMYLCRKEIMWKKMKPREQEQLAAEIRILRDLQHKHIVRYISETIDQETKMVYIYMEYCGNGDLFELIQSRKESSPVIRFSEPTVWQIFAQLALALFRCHNGVDAPPLEDVTNPTTLGSAQQPQPRPGYIVLHRDIKPHNVFLDHNNRVKLGDFGLSKELKGQNLAETYVGTPFYMSPEIIAGRAYNAKSDIWALGCCIYEMCSFDPPFQARDQVDLNRKIKLGMVGSITRFGYSDSLNAAIQSCLRQDEKVRPSAAGLLKRPEMIMARQQLLNLDREELLLERETALIAREKEIERAVNMKSEEIRRREEDLSRREEQLRRTEAEQTYIFHDSTQRKLLEAQRGLEVMAEEKKRLEERLLGFEAQFTRPQLGQHRQSDLPLQPGNGALSSHSSSGSLVGRAARPSIGRAQTELAYHREEDRMSSKLLPSDTNRMESTNKLLRSPQRRKSQIPMSRVRPDPIAREPLADFHSATQVLTRAASKTDLKTRFSDGLENVRPTSSTGFYDRSGQRSPVKEPSSKTLISTRKTTWATPPRNSARTLFAEAANDLRRENQRVAPPPPLRNHRLDALQKQGSSRHFAGMYEMDDEPSPYKKSATYGLRELE